MKRVRLHPTTAVAMTMALFWTGSAVAAPLKVSRREIVVSLPDRKLALLEDGQVVKIYRAAVGAPSSPSPTGEFTIVHRIPKPTYYAPGKIIRPGASNPLGTRWLGLSLKGFGIHGTNAPRSIGKNESHGCIRLRNRDVEDLFARVRVGDRVEIHREADDRIATIFGHTREAEAAAQPAEAAIAMLAQ
jgi:lipoprotein-anchoring transpeptidase ErfK/SrfK